MKMHAEEVDTSVSLVNELITTQFPEWASLPIKSIDSLGTDHAIYKLGEDMSVRLPRIY
jgi:aminoglycoside phosphotransferase (APT) family kinase protein